MKSEKSWVSIAGGRCDRKEYLSSCRPVNALMYGVGDIKRDCRVEHLEKEGIIW